MFVKDFELLLNDFKLRERYGRRGIEKAKQYSWEGVAKRMLNSYKELQNKKEKQATLNALL